jgi:diacylglycerol kinase family enzyme
MSASGAAAATTPPLVDRAPALIINPRSFAVARDGLAERAARLANTHGAEVLLAADSTQIHAATDLLLARPQQLIVLLAGDGTVRAVADRLASGAANLQRPQLLVLGGGRSNLTAAELGGAGGVLRKLETALQRHRDRIPLGTHRCHMLEIAQPNAPPRRGFFLAAGLVDYAIRACHRDRLNGGGRLRQSDAGTAWSLLKLALATMRGRLDPLLDHLLVDVPDGEPLADAAHLLLATTLKRRRSAIAPDAPADSGAVRFTAVAARGLGFWVRLPWILSGRFVRGMDAAHGYLSGRCDALRVCRLSSYTLDGEEYTADPSQPVTIRQGPQLTFATL